MPRKTKTKLTFGKFYYVYVLFSDYDRKLYKGYTTDLRTRVNHHQTGKGFPTSWRRPLHLIYYEACLDEEDAKARERHLKTTPGSRFLAKRLRNYLYE